MDEQELRDSADAVSDALLEAVGMRDMAALRPTMVHAIVESRMLPAAEGATAVDGFRHAGMIISRLALALGKALDELHELDPDDTAGRRHG